MRLNQLVCSMVFSLCTGVGGYFLGLFHGTDPSLALREIPGAESFVSGQSFSEVQNAKGVLQALAERCRTELRVRLVCAGRQRPGGVAALGSLVAELKERVKEFHGTEQEICLVQELLFLLKRQDATDEWLNTYLDVAYEHPRAELVRDLAMEAFHLAQRLGRSSELRGVFAHLRKIPRAVALPPQVLAALAVGSDETERIIPIGS